MFLPLSTIAALVYFTCTMKISNADAFQPELRPVHAYSSKHSNAAFVGIGLPPSQIINSRHVRNKSSSSKSKENLNLTRTRLKVPQPGDSSESHVGTKKLSFGQRQSRRNSDSSSSLDNVNVPRSISSSSRSCLNLVPSQTIHGNSLESLPSPSRGGKNHIQIQHVQRKSSLSQSSSSSSGSSQTDVDVATAAGTDTNINTNTTQATATATAKTTPTKQKIKRRTYKYYGNLPDINWRAIPMEHLRSHPLFIPLPHPDKIKHLARMEDARYFRQDSWQWDELHRGRCTTSQAAPALGFLELNAASDLGIPRSLQKGCMGAFQRLSQPSLRTLDEMNDILCTGGNGGEHRVHQVWKLMKGGNDGGTTSASNGRRRYNHNGRRGGSSFSSSSGTRREYPFVARYLPLFTEEQRDERKLQAKKYMRSLASPMVVRMQWGNSQEATAILTALNCFSKTDPGMRIREVGMCGAGLDLNMTISSTSVGGANANTRTNTINGCHLNEKNERDIVHIDDSTEKTTETEYHDGLILGASPDAVVEYSNGTLEVLEVKNHCPFVPTDWTGGKNKKKKKKKKLGDYRIRELPMQESVPPVYIPQLMMEMLCVGKDCRSAVMVRQTATCGAVLLRLHRDDEWIEEMLFWLQKFMTEYVDEHQPPPSNFFYESERYKKFLKWTKALAEQVDLVEHVPHSSIQRVLSDRGVGTSLFLD